MKCIEAEDEEVTHSTETFFQLSCFIEKGLCQGNGQYMYMYFLVLSMIHINV